MTAKELIRLIAVAQRPRGISIRIHFTRQFLDRSLTSQIPSQADEIIIPPIAEYTMTLINQPKLHKEMVLETMKSVTCKGYEGQRNIQKKIYFRYPMADFFRILYGCYLSEYLEDGPPSDRYFTVLKDDRIGFYILESLLKDGRKERFTVDGKKGFNVVRIEYFFTDGRIDYESIHDVRKLPNGRWFQTGYDLIRYADPKTGRQARYRQFVRVTDVEFDLKYNRKTFKIPEGVDAITCSTP